MSTIVFTHIPKTAGRSIRIGVFEPRVVDGRQHDPNGYWAALQSNSSFDLLAGHCSAYGIHRLYDVEKPRYFVMLREPIDRAVSYYYFVRQSSSNDSYTHPNLDDATGHTLAEFYQLPTYQNLQTRYVAGMGWEYIGRFLNLNSWVGSPALSQAKSNLLNEYEVFGLKERFIESVELMASGLDVDPEIPDRKHKSTLERPSVSELSEEPRSSLRRSNSLDLEIYEFARSHFDGQTTADPEA